jgi:glycosyltransferase involved in cell wall biosynthesis
LSSPYAGDESSFQERVFLRFILCHAQAGILTVTMAQQSHPRLLHVVDSFSPAAGGTTEAIRKLAESSPDNVELVCLEDPQEAYVQGQTFPVHALGSSKGSYHFSPRLQPWLKENLKRFDGLVIHGLWQWHSYGTYRVVHGRTPYVMFPHGMLDPYFKRAFPLKHLKKQMYWLAREHRVLRDARAVCFTTAIERDAAVETFWPHRWHSAVVSLGTSAPVGDRSLQREAFINRYPALRSRRFFLFLSRIHTKKGCDLLLTALERLAASHSDLDLVMAGPDEEGLQTKLEAQAKRLGIDDRVHWTGMLTGELKWGAFYASEAFVLPSHQENFGVAVVEALACQVPVLISDKVNIWPEIVQDQAGIVNEDTAEGTYRSMATLLAMTPEQRQRMVANGLACFRARYEMNSAARALEKLF